MTPARFFISAMLFASAALAVSWQSLDYYWNWDDLHIIRPYTGVEIASVFRGHWAVSPFETQGLRPFTTLFNYGRWALFGEHVVAHRSFLIALVATYLTLLGWLVCRLGGRWAVGLMAGVIAISAKNSYYHFVWIADGIHLFQALLFVGAAHLLLTSLDRRSLTPAIGSWLLATIALLTREDSLVFYAVLPLLAVFHAFRRSELDRVTTPLARYTAALACTWFAIWVWRLYAVPNAPQFKFAFDSILRVRNMALWTICLSGQRDGARYAFMALFPVLLGTAMRLDRRDRQQSFFWLALACLAVMPGNVRAVPNLLLFATSFYAVFLGSVLSSVAQKSAAGRLAAAAALIFIVMVPARASRLEQLSLHPMSTDQMYRDWTFIYGDHRTATIPAVRVQTLKAKLGRYGITSADFDFARWTADLSAQGRFVPNDRAPFVPPRRFLRP